MENKFYNDRVSYDSDYDPRFAPRFAEIATFFAPASARAWRASTSASRACRSTAARPIGSGTRHGPRAVRDLSSLMRATHHVFRINPFELRRIADVGDVRFNSLFDNAMAEKNIVDFYARFARRT